MRCNACRKPLTNEVSIRYWFGPSCLKRAVAAGSAPLIALEEQAAHQRTTKKRNAAKAPMPAKRDDSITDMFDAPRREAISILHLAVRECEALGIRVTLKIEE